MAEVVALSGVDGPVSEDERTAVIERAAAVLRAGGLVVVPTDTCYGVVADAFDATGTAALFAARGQDRSAPLTVFIRSPKQLIGLTPEVPAAADNLIAAYWPGPLTLVLPAESGMRWDLGDTRGALAVRMPLDAAALELCRAVGPLAVSSASKVGAPAPTDVAAARDQLGDAVAVYLDDGPRTEVVRSTIVDLIRPQPHVLREGAIDGERALAVARGELDPIEAASLDLLDAPADAGQGGAAEVSSAPDVDSAGNGPEG